MVFVAWVLSKWPNKETQIYSRRSLNYASTITVLHVKYMFSFFVVTLNEQKTFWSKWCFISVGQICILEEQNRARERERELLMGIKCITKS